MINEILTNSNWLNPQMDYLLWLQNLRMTTNGIFDQFFLFLTMFGELLIPVLFICVIYWCINSKAGLYLLTLNSLGLLFLQIFKMTACVYRPWILNNDIKPVEVAIKMARGYSFPSGHSAVASSIWGGMAFLTRKHKWLCISLILIVLLVAFSRTYLGVHTPQDVIVGVLTGLILVFAVNGLIEWCEQNKGRYLYLLGLIDIVIAVSLLYILAKNYPIDYLNGEILVNPQKAQYLSVIFFGWLAGILNGGLLCRRYFEFDASKGSLVSKIIRALLGVVLTLVFLKGIDVYIFGMLQDYKVAFIVPFLLGIFITLIYPICFTKLFKTTK